EAESADRALFVAPRRADLSRRPSRTAARRKAIDTKRRRAKRCRSAHRPPRPIFARATCTPAFRTPPLRRSWSMARLRSAIALALHEVEEHRDVRMRELRQHERFAFQLQREWRRRMNRRLQDLDRDGAPERLLRRFVDARERARAELS